MKIRIERDDGEITGSYEVADIWEPAIINLLSTMELAQTTTLQLRLESHGGAKIAVIKCLRAAYGMNLKDAKTITDRLPTRLPPLPEYEARVLMKEVRSVGGTITEPSAVDRLARIVNSI